MEISDPALGEIPEAPRPVGILYRYSVRTGEPDPPSNFLLSPAIKNPQHYRRDTKTQDLVGNRGAYGMLLAFDCDQNVLLHDERG